MVSKEDIIKEIKEKWKKILIQNEKQKKLVGKKLSKLLIKDLKEIRDEADLELYHIDEEYKSFLEWSEKDDKPNSNKNSE